MRCAVVSLQEIQHFSFIPRNFIVMVECVVTPRTRLSAWELYFRMVWVFGGIATEEAVGAVVRNPQPHDGTIATLTVSRRRVTAVEQPRRTAREVSRTLAATKELFNVRTNGRYDLVRRISSVCSRITTTLQHVPTSLHVIK